MKTYTISTSWKRPLAVIATIIATTIWVPGTANAGCNGEGWQAGCDTIPIQMVCSKYYQINESNGTRSQCKNGSVYCTKGDSC